MMVFLVALLILLTGAEAAHAELISGIAAIVIGGLGSLGSTALGLLAIGAKFLMSSLMQKEPKDRGVKLEAENGADKPPKIILGDWATSGHLLYHNSYGDDRSRYVAVYVLSAIPVQGLSNLLEVNGETCEIDFTRTNDFGMHPVVEYEDGREYLSLKFYDGTQTAPDPFLRDIFGNDDQFPWLADMLVKGCAYVVIRAMYSKEGIWSGSPQFLFGVKGARLYDFRKDSTVAGGSGSHRWNDPSTWTGNGYKNPVVQKYNIIRGIRYNGEVIWGGDAEAWRLPLSYWIAAANAADVEIEKKNGDKIPAFVTGAEIELDDQPIEFIKVLDRCHNGYTTEFGGIYKAYCGAPGLSVMTLTDEDFLITEKGEDDPFLTLEETYNSGVATHPVPKSGWVSDTTPLYVNAAALAADDGNESMLEADLPLVAETNQAQRVLRSMILDSRAQNKHTGVLPPIAMILEPHDRVSYISAREGYGGDGEDFIIGAKAHLPTVNQQVTLRGINAEAHVWLKEMEMDKTVGLPGRIRTGALALDITTATSWVNSDRGRDKPAILVEWDWADVDVDVARLDWRIRLQGTAEVIAHGAITDLLDGVQKVVHRSLRWAKTYQIQFRPQPISARKTSWTAWQTVTLVELEIPGNVVLTKRSVIAKDGTLDFWVKIDWNSLSGEVDYIVEITDADGDVQTRRTDGSSYKLKVSDAGVISARVRAVANDDGTRGPWTNPVSLNITAKNTAPITPAALTVEGGWRAIVLTLPESTERDVQFVNIYASATNDFTTATRIGRAAPGGTFTHKLGNEVTRYYWCTFVDRTTNESAKFPASNTSGRSATTSRITDDDFDNSGPATPTGLSLTARTILADDGWIDYRIKAQWNAISNAKASYILRVFDGSEYDYFTVSPDTGAVRKWFPAKSNVTFTVSVAAKSASGVVGAFTGNVTITPTKKALLPATPAGLVVTPGHKRNKLKWTKSPDSDYKETIIYRATSNNFANASEVDRKTGRSCTDDGLTNGTTYYYWISHVDRSDNESAKHPTSNTAGVAGTPSLIYADDTDPTPPATPATPPAIDQITADIDGDGSIDTALRLTLIQPSSGVPVKYFEVELHRASTVNGAYAAFGSRILVPSELVGDTLYDFKANQSKFYKARYRCISFSGAKGNYSALTAAGIQPLAYLGSIPTPTLTVTPKAKGMYLKWSAWQSNTYLETIVFRGGVEITRIKGNSFTDHEELSAGTSYSYSVQHLDKQNRVGAASGSVSGTYRAAASADIGPSAVTEANADQTAPATPAAAPAIGQITADIDGDGSIDTALRLTLTQPASGVPVKYFEVELQRSGTLGGTYAAFGSRIMVPAEAVGDTLYDVKANQSKFYKARYRCISFSGAKGNYSALTAAGVQPLAYLGSIPTPTLTVTPKAKGMFLKWSAWQSNTYLETIVFRGGVEITRIKGNSFTDHEELSAGTSYSYSVQHLDKQNRVGAASGSVAGTYRAAASADIGAGAVTEVKIDPALPVVGAAPTLTSLSADIDGDGTPDIGFTCAWSAIAASGSNPAARLYEVEVWRRAGDKGTDGDNATGYTFWRKFVTVDTQVAFEAKRKFFYKARVRGLAFNNQSGSNWSPWLNVGQQPNKYDAMTGTTPAAPVATPVANGIEIDWTIPADPTYAYTKLYQGAALVATLNGTSYTDTAARTVGTGYTYTVVHYDRAGNSTNSSPASNSAVYRALRAAETDQTLPAALSVAPVAGQVSVDVDGDGKTDIAIKWNWTKPTDTSNPIVGYQVGIYENGTLIDSFQTALTTVTRKVKTRVNVGGTMVASAYYAVIQTIGFNGKISAAGTFGQSNTVNPTKKAAVLAGTFSVSGLGVLQKDYGAYLSWTRSPEPDYMESRVYRYASSADAAADTNGADLGSLFGNWYQDIDVTIGAGYWYRVRHYDRSGNAGPLSAPVSLTVRGPSRVDNIAINADNLIPDADCADLSQWAVTQSNNDLVRLPNTGNFGPGRYKLRVTGTSVNIYSALIPIPPRGGSFRFSCFAGPEDGQSYDVGINFRTFYRNSAGVLVEGMDPDAPWDGSLSMADTTKTVSALTYLTNEFAVSGDFGIHFVQIKIRIVTASTSKQLNLASPTLVSIIRNAQLPDRVITARNIEITDQSNMLPDNGLMDEDSWTFTRGEFFTTADFRIIRFIENITAGADSTFIGSATSQKFSVTPGTVLKYGAIFDFDTSLSQGARLYLRFKDVLGNEISSVNISRATATTLSPEAVSDTVTVPANADTADIYIRRQVPSNGGTSAGTFKIYNIYVFRMASTDQMPASAVTQKYQALTSGSITLTTTAQTIQTDNVTWGSDFEWLVLDASFYVGANASNIPIVVEFAIGSTVLATVSTMTLANGVAMIKRGFSAAAIAAITSAASGTINVTARTTTGTLAISVRTLLSMVFKR